MSAPRSWAWRSASPSRLHQRRPAGGDLGVLDGRPRCWAGVLPGWGQSGFREQGDVADRGASVRASTALSIAVWPARASPSTATAVSQALKARPHRSGRPKSLRTVLVGDGLDGGRLGQSFRVSGDQVAGAGGENPQSGWPGCLSGDC